MKVNRLKRKLNRDGLYVLAVFVLILIISGLAFMKASQDEMELQRIKSEANNLSAEYSKLKGKIDNAKNNIDVYMNLPRNKIADENVSTDVTDWIRNARDPLLKLKNQYKINTLDLSLTPPVETKTGELNRESILPISSKVTLKFGVASDELLFSFVDSLIKEFPGYVRIESIEATRSGEITDQLIAQVAQQGVAPTLVHGTIIFEWIQLKHIVKNKPAVDTNQSNGVVSQQ